MQNIVIKCKKASFGHKLKYFQRHVKNPAFIFSFVVYHEILLIQIDLSL